MADSTPIGNVAWFSDGDLAELNREFEDLPAAKIIQWAVDAFAPHLCLTASMTDAVLIDLAVKVEPGIEVVFIDTGYHFPETLETVERVRRHYGLNLRLMTVPPHDEEHWKVDPENCCSAIKVGQLDRALVGKAAWMSGLRRDESPTRHDAPISVRAGFVGMELPSLLGFSSDEWDVEVRNGLFGAYRMAAQRRRLGEGQGT